MFTKSPEVIDLRRLRRKEIGFTDLLLIAFQSCAIVANVEIDVSVQRRSTVIA